MAGGLQRIEQDLSHRNALFDQFVSRRGFVERQDSIDDGRPDRAVRGRRHRPFHIGKITGGAADYPLPPDIEFCQIDSDLGDGDSEQDVGGNELSLAEKASKYV